MTPLWTAAAVLRAEIEVRLPKRASLRIDRTKTALYALRADEVTLAAIEKMGWTCIPYGPIALLRPTELHLDALRPLAPESPLTAPFASRPVDASLLPLFCAILRAREMPPTRSARLHLEKQLRQAMAVALRTRTGGGLEVCFSLLNEIPTK